MRIYESEIHFYRKSLGLLKSVLRPKELKAQSLKENRTHKTKEVKRSC